MARARYTAHGSTPSSTRTKPSTLLIPSYCAVDERGFAKSLIERVSALDRRGPPLLPEGEDEKVRVWYAKMLVRIARGDLEAKCRRVEINYFKLRGLWYRGPKASLAWLASPDLETRTAFTRALEPHASPEVTVCSVVSWR
jgi:hypothetical protein